MKSRNGQISPREMQHSNNYSNHQNNYHHYSTQNHSNNSSSSSSSSYSSHQKPPHSDLIDFVHGAWKEKVSGFGRIWLLNLTQMKLILHFRARRRSSRWRQAKSIVTLISMAGCEHGSSTKQLKMNLWPQSLRRQRRSWTSHSLQNFTIYYDKKLPGNFRRSFREWDRELNWCEIQIYTLIN